MIKAGHTGTNAHESVAPNLKTLECWSRDPQAQALRVELDGGQCFIFPYTHFVFASLGRAEDQDALRISFTTHDVRVRGRGLVALLNAVQKMSVDWIKPLPKRYEKCGGRCGRCCKNRYTGAARGSHSVVSSRLILVAFSVDD
jgi:hypothetical protein